MFELVAAAGLLYLIYRAPAHNNSRDAKSDPSIFLNDPLARTFVLPRNVKLERGRLAELSQAQIKHGTNASLHAGNYQYAGAARFANNTALSLPGGSLYYHSGLDPHHIARITNPYTHEVSR